MQLNLNAQLRAYSRAPFYSDWVRDVSPDGEYNPDIVWARAKDETGKTYWQPLDKKLLDANVIQDVINRLEQTESTLHEGLSSIYITPPRYDAESKQLVIRFYNEHGWTDAGGNIQHIQQIAIPSSYPDNKTIYKDVANSLELSLVNTADEDTIEIVPQEIRETSDAVGNIRDITTGKLRATAIYVSEPRSKWTVDNKVTGDTLDTALNYYDNELDDLKAIVQGESGYLDPMPSNFVQEGESVSTALTRWALQQLQLQAAPQIPNNTKVLYPEDAHPANRNLYVFVTSSLYQDPWKDMGKDTVVEATNNGVLGVVTGTNKKYGVSIVAPYIDNNFLVHTGEMLVNGVEEEFTQVVYKGENTSSRSLDQVYIQTEENIQSRADVSEDAMDKTLAMRTAEGNIRCSDPVTDTDAVNLQWFNRQFLTEAEIEQLLEEVLND